MYHVDIVNNGDTLFQVKSKDHEFAIDTKGGGVTPPDALLAALGSCVGVYVRKYAQGRRLDIGEFSISVDADFTEGKPICFKSINVNIDLKGAQLDDKTRDSLSEFVKNCPVHNTLKENPRVEISLS